MTGEMSFAAMVLMSIGYVIPAGITGVKWGLLYRMTGNAWTGLGDHLLNNTVATKAGRLSPEGKRPFRGQKPAVCGHSRTASAFVL